MVDNDVVGEVYAFEVEAYHMSGFDKVTFVYPVSDYHKVRNFAMDISRDINGILPYLEASNLRHQFAPGSIRFESVDLTRIILRTHNRMLRVNVIKNQRRGRVV